MAYSMHMDYMACIHNALTYAMLWTRHMQCNNQTCDNMDYRAYTTQDGLKPIWMGLGHTQISGPYDENEATRYMQTCTNARDQTYGTTCNSTKAWQGYNDTCSSSEMTYKIVPNHANNSPDACWMAQLPKQAKCITVEVCKAMPKWPNQP